MNVYLRDVYQFYSLINQLEATGRSSSSDILPCANCSARIQQGDLVFEEDNQRNYNALHVASEVEAFHGHGRPLTLLQIEAHEGLKSLLAGRTANSLIRRLGAEDARQVSREEYLELLNILADMFFPSTLPTLKFDFCEATADLYGACSPDGVSMLVTLHPTLHKEIPDIPQNSVLNERAVSRLSTLLHELCHAFVRGYACQQCPGFNRDVENMKGHGFAWQRTALAIEFAAQGTLGLPINLGRLTTIRVSFIMMRWPPSREEAARWHLEGHPAAPRYNLRAGNRAE